MNSKWPFPLNNLNANHGQHNRTDGPKRDVSILQTLSRDTLKGNYVSYLAGLFQG